MVSIIFETHSTTFDNENEICSGFFDVELSPLGVTQAGELGFRRKEEQLAAIFCSDLQRSYKTAKLAYGERFLIIQDPRLRECDYGDFTRCTREVMNAEQFRRITEPFPRGESYEQAFARIGEFLKDLLRDYDGQRVMIIGHGATRGGLEYWINGLTVQDAIIAAKKWQPGWEYKLRNI